MALNRQQALKIVGCSSSVRFIADTRNNNHQEKTAKKRKSTLSEGVFQKELIKQKQKTIVLPHFT